MKRILFSISFILLIVIPTVNVVFYLLQPDGCSKPESFIVEIQNKFKRDPQSFTQGFFIHENKVYESFGQYGVSGIKSYDLDSLNPKDFHSNNSDVFAEGAAFLGEEIIQISWKKGRAYRYNQSLKLIGEFIYQGDGWGITSSANEFVMSDGSDEIQFRSADDFKLLRKIQVKELEKKVDQLNELEFINGEIWANIWQKDEIVAIDSDSGCVLKKIDASSLWDYENSSKKSIGGVLNGIAYDSELGHIYLTGKYWQNIFQIKLKNKE